MWQAGGRAISGGTRGPPGPRHHRITPPSRRLPRHAGPPAPPRRRGRGGSTPPARAPPHLVGGVHKVLDLGLRELAHAQQARARRDLVAVRRADLGCVGAAAAMGWGWEGRGMVVWGQQQRWGAQGDQRAGGLARPVLGWARRAGAPPRRRGRAPTWAAAKGSLEPLKYSRSLKLTKMPCGAKWSGGGTVAVRRRSARCQPRRRRRQAAAAARTTAGQAAVRQHPCNPASPAPAPAVLLACAVSGRR